MKAFYRLARKTKQDFPQLRIYLVADGLYAGAPTLALCQALGWKYLIVLRDKARPTVWQWVQMLRPFMVRNRRTLQWQRPDGTRVRERCRWTTEINYRGQTVHVLEYEETVQDAEPRRWAWITNLELTWENGLD